MAKKYSSVRVRGVDYWGGTWEYSKGVCERNATIEGVKHRVTFLQASASSLPFDDETFDVVISNLTFHGVADSKDKRLSIKEALRVGYRIIAPSRFGYLGTPILLEPSIELLADVYASFLDALRIKRTVVLGFSSGGLSALQFTLRHPHRTIALIMASAVSYTEPLSDAGRRRLESGINRIIGFDSFLTKIVSFF